MRFKKRANARAIAERRKWLRSMHQKKELDLKFETGFFESILQKDRSYADVVEILGGLYTRQGRIAEGLKMDRRLVRMKPDHAVAHYNLACSLALMKRKKDALRSLQDAIERGYDDAQWMAKDPDLEILRGNPLFVELLRTLREKKVRHRP